MTVSAAPARVAATASPGGHRLEHGKSEALDARGEDIDQDPLVPERHLFDRQFAEEADAIFEPGGGDALFQALDERQIVDRDVADDDGGEVGIFRQEAAHRLDEEIAALLPPHPAERADAIFPRQAGRAESGGAILRRPVDVEIDAVMDDGRRAAQEGRRILAGGDDRVHPLNEKLGIARLAALPGGIENELEPPAEEFQREAKQHLGVAPRVPDPRLPAALLAQPQPHEVRQPEAGDAFRPVRTEPCRPTALRDQRSDGPVDRRAAGIALFEVRE